MAWHGTDGTAERGAAISVVVPIYNAADDLVVCIERLAAYTPDTVDILLVDDASPDPRIGEILQQVATRTNMRVLRNEANLGFACSVNRGLSEAARNDVIILNSDARVTPGWFEGMSAAARAFPNIATVTAMSDRAGAFSAPNIGNDNDLPPGVDEITYARAFRRRSLGLYPTVPTGNGFCMFISRSCLDEIGALDADAFPRGYGEENDFCMRAGRAGWRNIIDDRTYVFHDRSKSFGDEKNELLATSRAVIDKRYPEYKKAIAVYSEGLPICLARYQARRALIDCELPTASLPRALYVVSTQTGGTPQTNKDLMAALGDALDTWVLRCDSRVLELSHFRDGLLHIVSQHRLEEPVDPITHVSFEYDVVVAEWIRNLDVELVHIRHLGWHSLSLPQIARSAGTKVVFSFHDFYTLSPTVKLLDDTNTFCGGRCTASQGDCSIELWPQDALPWLKNGWVHVWREKFARALVHCDSFITTSDSARARILEAIPELPADRFQVIPHGRDFPKFEQLRELPVRGEPLRILLPGNISAAKGLDTVYDLLERDTAGLLEFHVLGKIDMTDRSGHPRLFQHGEYARDEFPQKVAPLRPHMGAVLSIWDETYCHTLTELWSVGLPVIVFDFPTVATRVRQSGGGWVMDHEDVGALYGEIIRVAFDSEEQSAKNAALAEWQAGEGIASTTRLMAAKYLDVYRAITGHAQSGRAKCGPVDTASPRIATRRPRIAVVCPSGIRLQEANASTEVRIWERTRNGLDRDVTYIRMVPSSLLANIEAGGIDAAILQRAAIPKTLVPAIARAFADTAVPYLFDLDDDLMHVPADKDPEGCYADYAPLLTDLISGAALVTLSTPPLLGTYRRLNRNAVLLPNRLSQALWRGALPERQPDGLVRGLYMGSTTHHADFELVRPALESVARRHPGFRLAVIGVMPGDVPAWAERIDVPPEARSYARFVPWLRSLAGRFDFAVAPLEDTPFNASKSPLKVLEYGALGLPVLASDVSAYRDTAQAAPGALCVPNTVGDWTAALTRQVALGAGNRKHGDALRRWVFETHALEPSLPDFDALVLSMLGQSRISKAGSCSPAKAVKRLSSRS
jgi:GT2 family glycosyltransferase/glycosyltransferase involved in cell wall biosynthesis